MYTTYMYIYIYILCKNSKDSDAAFQACNVKVNRPREGDSGHPQQNPFG